VRGLPVDEPINSPIYIDLPPAARRAYDEMEEEMYTILNREGVEAANAAVRTQKCLQLANGAMYTDEYGSWQAVHDAKLDALESVIEEANGAPVLVAYNFKHDLERLRGRFRQGRVLDADPQTIRDWNAGRISILFAHPASAGHGLNLADGGNILAFYGVNWNLEEHMQIIERIGPMRQKQAGYDRPVFIYPILARHTVDDLVMARLSSKKSVQEILLEAMKRKAK
jgi:SNF2 family DNA or RNA helicase